MSIYLENKPLQEAYDLWFAKSLSLLDRTSLREDIPVRDAVGRITAEPVFARRSSPSYHASAMDGYAVSHEATFDASETNPVFLKIPDQAVYLNTGDPVPDGFNSVIMIEDVNETDIDGKGDNKRFIEIIDPVTPWQNVRVTGEDIVATELVVPQNHLIRPVDVAAILAGGIRAITVKKRAVVGVIPTGDEIVEEDENGEKGKIIDTNSWMLKGLLEECGAEFIHYPIVPDDRSLIGDAVRKAVEETDMVLVIAGSSAGTEDFTAEVVQDLGTVVVHGVNIKPGKPVVLGHIGSVPVVGIPGYPVSTFVVFRLFVLPLLNAVWGAGVRRAEVMNAILSRQISSKLGVEEFIRMKLGRVFGKTVATPVSRGAGLIMSLVRADGLLRVPALSEGFGAGSSVEIELLKDREDIENTIVVIGSHDNTIDVMANILKVKYQRFSLSSAHVGSMGGIMAIKNGEAHVAGTHLYDEEAGDYNVPFIRKFLYGKNLRLINLVYREQGLLVKKGNPKGIESIRDLERNDIMFINRQPGSGTRLLTDKCLKDLNIERSSVLGYENVEYTHMAVASAVKSGVADAGIGIHAASVALGLDFIPVAKERYDLIVPEECMEDEKVRVLLEIVEKDGDFREAVMKLGGYDPSDMGKIVYRQ